MWDKFIGVDQGAWKDKAPPGNINLDNQWASSCPVDKFAHGDLYDVVGNVWQHLETPTYPYKGFRPHPLYDDFSIPTMDGRHYMMRGGAWISTGNEATRDARYAFRRHFFQFIGIRYVEGVDVDETKLLTNVLGMDPQVDLAAQRAFFVPAGVRQTQHAGARAAALAFDAATQALGGHVPSRALEVQCGAARISFELAGLGVGECIGVHFSARDLQPAFSMRERGTAAYSVVANAITHERKAMTANATPDFAASWGPLRESACFYQSDPANLHAHLDDFDLVVGFDTLSHTYKPSVVPAHLASRVSRARGGVVVLFEPREAGLSAVTDETLASVQKQPRPSSTEIAELLVSGSRSHGRVASVCSITPWTFDIFDGVVSTERVGITRLSLDMIVVRVAPVPQSP
jgi:hypothetical protein